jgi:hypothetical protein
MRAFFILSIFVLVACQRKENQDAFHYALKQESSWAPQNVAMNEDMDAMVDVPATAQPAPPSVQMDRKLIKNAKLSFKVSDLTETKKQIDKLVKEINGYPSNETQSNFDEQLQSTISIRVPASKFDDFITNVLKLAIKVDSKNITTEDVTEEFIDTEARIKTKKELETRYREILKQAKTVEEILSIESNLSNVRTEIESAEGKLNYLKSQVSMSTVNITYYQIIGTDFGFVSKLVLSFKAGWENLLVFLIGMISVWPFVLIIGVGGFWFWRKRSKSKTQMPEV